MNLYRFAPGIGHSSNTHSGSICRLVDVHAKLVVLKTMESSIATYSKRIVKAGVESYHVTLRITLTWCDASAGLVSSGRGVQSALRVLHLKAEAVPICTATLLPVFRQS